MFILILANKTYRILVRYRIICQNFISKTLENIKLIMIKKKINKPFSAQTNEVI